MVEGVEGIWEAQWFLAFLSIDYQGGKALFVCVNSFETPPLFDSFIRLT
jgi:hypothetical protein